MRITFVGTGDAFGTGGRAHTCIRIDAGARAMLVDFGASSILSWRRLGFSFNEIEAILITHLHGDHFGGLPFLLLEAQFIDPRERPLSIFGPPGLRSRLAMAMEAFFPGTTGIKWRFPFEVVEIAPPARATIAGFDVETVEVIHAAGAPATGARIGVRGKMFAFSGDTAWTENLVGLADGADLFLCECHSLIKQAPGHMDWPMLREQLPRLKSKRTLLTHMGPQALASLETISAEADVQSAYDGLVVEI